MAYIQVNNVSLSYRLRSPLSLRGLFGLEPTERQGRMVHALRDVSFSLSSGDRLGLVGHNGAGKTTLLNLLYGIYSPTSGQIRVEGRRDALFNISLGFRGEATGRRNIRLRGLMQGWSAAEIAERTEEIIAFSELGDFIDMPYKTYSQGMAARLAFAAATAMEPDILLMDEWIGAGDRSFQIKAKSRMAELAKRARIIVLASHNKAILQGTCNKILELDHGSVVSLMDAEQWFKERADAF